ncbi:uncharacterized protein UTRI_10104 [Ustilago trichophora]|uniref:Uncharacterized protein n=1 Tax=Ustilago trichophora TaxID=86804 RepID=A0A5C3E4F9_9BASI|nr:uncharacterized protein UTRI_10104 [Ustilago trichophora]
MSSFSARESHKYQQPSTRRLVSSTTSLRSETTLTAQQLQCSNSDYNGPLIQGPTSSSSLVPLLSSVATSMDSASTLAGSSAAQTISPFSSDSALLNASGSSSSVTTTSSSAPSSSSHVSGSSSLRSARSITSTSSAPISSTSPPSCPRRSVTATQKQREAQSGRNYFHWNQESVEALLDILYTEDKYARSLIGGRLTADEEKSSKMTKESLYSELFQRVFPEENIAGGGRRIKGKLRALDLKYKELKKQFSSTGSGILLQDMNPDHSTYTPDLASQEDEPMMEDEAMLDSEDDTFPSTRTIPGLETIAASSQEDPYASRVLSSLASVHSNSVPAGSPTPTYLPSASDGIQTPTPPPRLRSSTAACYRTQVQVRERRESRMCESHAGRRPELEYLSVALSGTSTGAWNLNQSIYSKAAPQLRPLESIKNTRA